MRLEPVERPASLMLRLAFAMSRRQLGKVMSPLKVVYARLPALLLPHYQLTRLMEDDVLPPRLRALVTTWVSTLNGCSFCADLHQATALQQGQVDRATLRALGAFEEEPGFSAAERAALAYAEEVTLNRGAEDATFARLREHFTEEEIVYLTWLVAMTCYLNLLARPLGLESDGFCALLTGEAAG